MPKFSGRLLLSLKDIDVARDILEVRFKSMGEDSNFVLFTLDLVSWDERGITIGINFTNPMDVSLGE